LCPETQNIASPGKIISLNTLPDNRHCAWRRKTLRLYKIQSTPDSYRDQHPNIATKIKIGVITKNRCNPQLKYPLLYHRHKIVFKLLADGDLLIGDVDVVILYFMELFGIDDIGVVHPHKGR